MLDKSFSLRIRDQRFYKNKEDLDELLNKTVHMIYSDPGHMKYIEKTRLRKSKRLNSYFNKYKERLCKKCSKNTVFCGWVCLTCMGEPE